MWMMPPRVPHSVRWGGAIHVHSAARFVKAKTMGDRSRSMRSMAGSDASTMGGNVEATMTGDPSSGKRSVALTSMAGDITLSVPGGSRWTSTSSSPTRRGHEGDYTIKSDFPVKQEVSPGVGTGQRVPAQDHPWDRNVAGEATA